VATAREVEIMDSIVFEANVRDGTIEIPEAYQDAMQQTQTVQVTLVNPQQRKTFLQTARSLALEGEPDWSEQIDQYLYGENVAGNG
jgi:hypothetical protein